MHMSCNVRSESCDRANQGIQNSVGSFQISADEDAKVCFYSSSYGATWPLPQLMKGTPCKMRTIRRPPVPLYPMAILTHNEIASIWSFGVLRLSASRILIDWRWMVDDESLSQGYRLLAESRRSILVFRLPCIATKAYPWFFYADLNLCGPRRIICSLTEGYQEYPHVPSKPQAS